LGANWQTDLIEALQTCSAFVPVYSLNYFASDICGREWGLFQERVTEYAQAKRLMPLPSQVAPALWLGKADLDGKIPARIADIQYSNKRYGEPYVDYGFENLLRRRRTIPWGNAVQALCDDVVRLHNAHGSIPRSANPPLAIEMASSMWNSPGGRSSRVGPRWVQFIFLSAIDGEIGADVAGQMSRYAEARELWRPFLPVEGEAIRLATEVVVNEGLFYQSIDIDDQTKNRVAEASKRSNLVALIVDTWSLQLAHYSDIAAQVDDPSMLNCVVVLPLGPQDETPDRREKLQKILDTAFPKRIKGNDELISIDAVRSPDAFRARLAKALARARAALDAGDAARQVPSSGSLPMISAPQS
jgi:FxsC-like protein